MPKTTGRAVGERRWSVVYWALMASFLMATALNLARVAGGFLTDYLADLTVPALLYVLARELAPGRRLALPRATQWVGRTPERAATVCPASDGTRLPDSRVSYPAGSPR
jgi:hypothetical protein